MSIARGAFRYFTIFAAIGITLFAILLCLLARTVGVNSEPSLLTVSADYWWLGWTLRIMAAILAAVALLVLFLDRRAMRQQFVSRNLGRLGIGLATAALFWEIAVPAATIAFIAVGLWAFFTAPGDPGDIGFDIGD